MWNILIQNISKKGVELTAEEVDIVQALFRHKVYRKKQYILQQGDATRYENFVVKGLVRTYTVDEKGQEHISALSPENWWAGDLYSFFTGEPAESNIDCLEPTEVLQITKDDIELLCGKVPKMNIYFRILYRNSVIALSKRIKSTLDKTALERYHEFLQNYAQIEQRVPNHVIASFLGIAPQSLSRIRKQAVMGKE